jgi:hypothetical protein
MCAHEVDEFGYPADPELRALEFHLCDLAAAWRSSKDDPQRRENLIKDYHATMDILYALGWDSEPDFECHLPDELMPEEFNRRNPIPDSYSSFSDMPKLNKPDSGQTPDHEKE